MGFGLRPQPIPRLKPDASALGVRKEQLLPVDLVVGVGPLTVGGHDPVDELQAQLLLHVGELGRIHQDDAVLVEEALVPFHQDGEVSPVLEGQPGAPVGQDVGAEGGGGVAGWAHAGAGVLVPGALGLVDVDAGRFPIAQFGGVGAALVAAGDEGRLGGFQLLEGVQDALVALRLGRVILGAHQNEVVVHHFLAFDAIAVGHEFLFAPIAMLIRNQDVRSKDYEEIARAYRPSHADYTYDAKYGIRAVAGGGRASARETAGRVAAGAIARQLLAARCTG